VVTDAPWTIGPAAAGTRLDKFLGAVDRLGSRARAASALERGKVYLNGAVASVEQAAVHLREGDVVDLWMDRPGTAKRRVAAIRAARPVPVVHEDEELLVLNKPPGLLVVPLERRSAAPSVLELIADRLRSHKRRPYVVHRIDRDTSGLVVFAKDARTQQQLRSQFEHREPERVYLAVVYGHPEPRSGTWRDRFVWDSKALLQRQTYPGDPRGQDAVSRYRVIESFETASLIEVKLTTGKRNQIRLQAHVHGHTLVGERRYVSGTGMAQPIDFPRQALHAAHLEFRHPHNGRLMQFDAPLPSDLAALLERLRRH